jgi:hypothetical protein
MASLPRAKTPRLPGMTAATDAAAAVLQNSRRFHDEIRSLLTVLLLPYTHE